MKWAQCKVFERVSNIYTFSKDPLLQKNIRKHIFIPWNQKEAHDLMFRLKEVIENKVRFII